MGSRIYKFGRKIRLKNLYLASKNKGKIEEYKKLLAGVNCKLLLQPESLDAKISAIQFAAEPCIESTKILNFIFFNLLEIKSISKRDLILSK